MNRVRSEDTVQYRVAVDSNEDDDLAELLLLTKHVARYGTITYRNSEDQLHRIWGPAIILPDGTVHWYRDGVRHRSDGPASEYSSGSLLVSEWSVASNRRTCNDTGGWSTMVVSG